MYNMNNKTWIREPIQTWSSLNELKETKKNYYKAYMSTSQIVNWVKAGAHLREEGGMWGLDAICKTNQIVPSILPLSK